MLTTEFNIKDEKFTMGFPIITQINAIAQLNENEDLSEHCYNIFQSFCDQTFWILGEHKPTSDGKSEFSAVYHTLPETGDNIIYSYLSVDENTQPECLPAIQESSDTTQWIAINGFVILKLATMERFALVVTENSDNYAILEHDQIMSLIIAAEEKNEEIELNQPQKAITALDMPLDFCRQLYLYCSGQKEIYTCRLALVNITASTSGFDNFTLLMLLDCGDKERTHKHFAEIKKNYMSLLPMNIELIFLTSDSSSHFNQLANLIHEAKPFYSKQDSQGFFAKLKRRLRHPLPIALVFKE